MGRSSAPKTPPDRTEKWTSIVGDCFEIRGDDHPDYEPGVVVVLRSCRPPDFAQLVGRVVRVKPVDGKEFEARIDAIKDHGTTVSLYFKSRVKADVPIGSAIRLPALAESGFSSTSVPR